MRKFLAIVTVFILCAGNALAWGGNGYDNTGVLFIPAPPAQAYYLDILGSQGLGVGIGSAEPAQQLEVNGVAQFDGNSIIIGTPNTPADNATCTAGTIWWDTGFLYLCAVSGTVKRVALSTF